jgi:hypothetical protein
MAPLGSCAAPEVVMACPSVVVIVSSPSAVITGHDMDHSAAREKQTNSAMSRKSDGKAITAGGLSARRFSFPKSRL